jgi:hypothetical protein
MFALAARSNIGARHRAAIALELPLKRNRREVKDRFLSRIASLGRTHDPELMRASAG